FCIAPFASRLRFFVTRPTSFFTLPTALFFFPFACVLLPAIVVTSIAVVLNVPPRHDRQTRDALPSTAAVAAIELWLTRPSLGAGPPARTASNCAATAPP